MIARNYQAYFSDFSNIFKINLLLCNLYFENLIKNVFKMLIYF